MTLKQLMELRESIGTSIRQLEDMKAGQALSTNQQKALDKYMLQAGDLDEQIAEQRAADSEAAEQRSATIARICGGQPAAGPSPVPGPVRTVGDVTAGAQADSAELRSFGLGDELRSIARPAAGPNLAAVVRGMATGDWSHVPAEQRGLISSGAAAAIPGASVLMIQEMAMQQSVVFKAGARAVNIDRPNERVARVVATGTPEWLPDTAERELNDQTFTIVPEDLTAFSAWLYTECSIESLEDAYGLEGALDAAYARQLALLYDQAAVALAAENMPKSICAMTNAVDGINELTGAGLLEDYSPFVRAAGTVLAAHHTPTSVMVDVDQYTTLALLTDSLGQPIEPPTAYTDLSQFVTTFLPTGNAIVADWTKWLFGTRTGMTLEVSRLGTGFKKGMVAIRAYVRFGGIPLDPTAFCRISGITTDPIVS